MSLILEALKKLERDKQVDDRGFLVMAARPWPTGDGRRLLLAAGVLAAVGLGGLTVAGFWLWQHHSAPQPATPAVAAAPATTVAAAPRAPAAGAAPVQRTIVTDRPLRIAPDAPPTAAPVASPKAAAKGPRLTAISQRDGKPIAILNDRVVFEGDGFDGIKVLHIGDSEVELEVDGHRQTVHF